MLIQFESIKGDKDKKDEATENATTSQVSEAVEQLRRSSFSTAGAVLNDLDNQMKFYERVKNSFFLELDKTKPLKTAKSTENMATTPTTSGSLDETKSTTSSNQLSPSTPSAAYLSQKRRSTSFEQKYFAFLTVAPPQPNEDTTNNEETASAVANEGAADDEDPQRRRSVALQLLDLHDYSGEVVGGIPLAKPSLSRSSSRSSSVSSMHTTGSRKSISMDMETTANVPEHVKLAAKPQMSLDLMPYNAGDSPFSASINSTPNTVINCLVPTIVVHHHETKTSTSRDQVNYLYFRLRFFLGDNN